MNAELDETSESMFTCRSINFSGSFFYCQHKELSGQDLDMGSNKKRNMGCRESKQCAASHNFD